MNWESLVELQRSKELYNFSIEHADEDFNDYVEMLDDDSNLTSDTLNDMNSVAMYFKTFKDRMTNNLGLTNFFNLLEFMSLDFYSHSLQEV